MSLLKVRSIYALWMRFVHQERVVSVRKGATPFYIKQRTDLSLNKILQSNGQFSDDQWHTIRKELVKCDLPITDINVDAAIIDTCCDADNPPAALSYIKFVKALNNKLNVAITGKYFKLLHDHREKLSDEDIKDISELYDAVRAEYSILDALTAENCVLALSLTQRWRDCLELIEMIEFTSCSRAVAHSSVMAASFDNDDVEIGWKLAKEMVPRLLPSKRAYDSYLKYCIRNSKNAQQLENNVEKMFEFWADTDIYPPLNIIESFVEALKDAKVFIAEETGVRPDGICMECRHKLPALQLSNEDFDYLSKTVFTNVLVGDDVYNNSNPAELKEFKIYVEQAQPYDVVIDGLNAAYSAANYSKQKINLAAELAAVVRAFVERKKKVFVLGRKHMSKWSPADMNYIRNNSHIFLANDLSRDDPYLLYATLRGGINTYFSSRDFMRQHKFILTDHGRKIFRHWQMTRQISPISTSRTIRLIYPPKYVPIAQKDPNGWHIPYSKELVGKEVQLSRRPTTWMCLRRKKKQ